MGTNGGRESRLEDVITAWVCSTLKKKLLKLEGVLRHFSVFLNFAHHIWRLAVKSWSCNRPNLSVSNGVKRSSSFGDIDFRPGHVVVLPRRQAEDTYDYDKLEASLTCEWELAGEISKRIGQRAQHVGGRLAKLWNRGRIERAISGTDIFWRKL